MECVLAAAMLEYKLALGLLQYEPGDGKIDAAKIDINVLLWFSLFSCYLWDWIGIEGAVTT